MLEVDSIVATYGALTALNRVSLTLEPGARVAIFGHNGAGKTTLLRCMIGAHTVAAGEVRFDGQPIAPGRVAVNVRRGIAFVPQGRNVFPTLSVEQNLRTAGLMFEGSVMPEVLRIFPVLSERRRQPAGLMSGGEQQMLALGMALMTQPKWLLLDEPSTGLAPVIVRDVMARLRTINESLGTGLVMVEQNVPTTLKAVDRAVILKAGQVVFDDTAGKLAEQPDLWEWF